MDSQRNHVHLANPRLEYAFRAWGPSRFALGEPNVALADERDDEVAPEQIAAELSRRKPLRWQDLGLTLLQGGIDPPRLPSQMR